MLVRVRSRKVETTIIRGVAHPLLVGIIHIVPRMTTQGFEETINIYHRNALRMEHHIQQVGITLTHSMAILKNSVRIIIPPLVTNIGYNPIKYFSINLCF